MFSGNIFAKGPDTNFVIADVNVTPAPQEAAKFVTEMSHFVPAVNPDPTELAALLAVNASQDYLKKPMLADTVITSETDTSVLQSRSAEMKYTVKGGDTMSDISYRFNLKVASIKYVNGIDSDDVKPGQVITVPARDVNQGILDAWQAEKDRKAQEEEAARRRQLASTLVQRRATNVNVPAPVSNASGLVRPMSAQYKSRGVSWGHTGADLVGSIGTPVVSTSGGVVEQAASGWNGGYGNEVVVNHGGGIKSRYAHLSAISVSPGQSVGAGQLVGLSGNSGRSTGPHLHFEYIVGGRFAEPF